MALLVKIICRYFAVLVIVVTITFAFGNLCYMVGLGFCNVI